MTSPTEQRRLALIKGHSEQLRTDPAWEGLYLTKETGMTVHLLRQGTYCSLTIGLQWIPITRNQCLVYRSRMLICRVCWHRPVDFDVFIGAGLAA